MICHRKIVILQSNLLCWKSPSVDVQEQACFLWLVLEELNYLMTLDLQCQHYLTSSGFLDCFLALTSTMFPKNVKLLSLLASLSVCTNHVLTLSTQKKLFGNEIK